MQQPEFANYEIDIESIVMTSDLKLYIQHYHGIVHSGERVLSSGSSFKLITDCCL